MKLKLRTARQVALFNTEISGQLSDGSWENTQPHDHWKVWCDCEVEVAEDGNVGRNFSAIKSGYALHSLIEYIGDRMVFIGNLADICPEAAVSGYSLPDSEWDWNHLKKKAADESYTGDYYLARWIALDEAGVTDEIIEAAANGDYTEQQLRKDLSEIKKAMKTLV